MTEIDCDMHNIKVATPVVGSEQGVIVKRVGQERYVNHL